MIEPEGRNRIQFSPPPPQAASVYFEMLNAAAKCCKTWPRWLFCHIVHDEDGWIHRIITDKMRVAG